MKILSQILQWFIGLFGSAPLEPDSREKPTDQQQPSTAVVDSAQETERICGQITQSAETIINLMRNDWQKARQQVSECSQLVDKLENLLQE